MELEEDIGLDFRHLRASGNTAANEGLDAYDKAADIRLLSVSVCPPQYSAILFTLTLVKAMTRPSHVTSCPMAISHISSYVVLQHGMLLAAAIQEYLSATNEERESFHAQGFQRLDEDVVLMPSGRRLACGTQVNQVLRFMI